MHRALQANRRGLAFLDTEIRSLESTNRARYVALRDYLEHMLLDTVQAGVSQGHFTTPIPTDASRAVLTMCQGVANWYRAEGPLSPETIADRHVLLCLGVVGCTGILNQVQSATGDQALFTGAAGAVLP